MPPPPRPFGPPRAYGPHPPSSSALEPKTADLLAAIMAGQAQTNSRFDEVVGKQRELAAAVEAADLRVDGVERTLAEVDPRASATEARLRALESRLASSAAPSSTASAKSGPSNPHNYDIFLTRVSAKQTVTLDAVRHALQGLLARARLDDADVKLDGPLAGNIFYSHPRAADAAERGRVTDAVHEARRCSDGSWAIMQAELPNGGRVQLFADRDRS